MKQFTELTPRQEAALEVLVRKGYEADQDGFAWKAELCKRKIRELLEGQDPVEGRPFGSRLRHYADLRRQEAADA